MRRGRAIITKTSPIKAQVATGMGKLAYTVLHGVFKGGSSYPGKLAQKIDPNVLAALGKNYDVIVVTGTNGKTLTTNLVVKVLGQKYDDILSNPTGSNMMRGIITAFLAHRKHFKKGERGLAVLEVDEANVAPVSEALNVKAYVLTNIFRDQMDRYGEFYTTYEKILTGIKMHPDALVIANGDAPIFHSRELKNPMRYFGFDRGGTADMLAPVNTDGVLCPQCQHILHYHEMSYSNLGDYFCPHCGFKRPTLTAKMTGITDQTPTSSAFIIDGHNFSLSIGGTYNIYNALAAYSVGQEYGINADATAKAFAYDEKVFGRQEVVDVKGKQVTLVLVKNPVGMNQVLEMIGHADKSFAFGFLLNAKYADGKDTSWIWDTNLEEFVASKQATTYLVGGERFKDIQFRMEVAGVDPDKLLTQPDLTKLPEQIASFKEDSVYLLATYTAMLQLRKTFADGGYINKGFGK